MKVQLFITCLSEQFFPETLQNMVFLLEELGVEPVFPEDQTCCGQPYFNTGFQKEGRSLAAKWIRLFGRRDLPIVSPSGSCVDMVKHHYPDLFPDGSEEQKIAQELSNRTFEFSQFLVNELKITDVGATFPHKVTYHASCHLLRGLSCKDEPKRLLNSVTGLEFIPLPEEETCCGFGGAFSVIYPQISQAMLTQKINKIIESGAEYVVACDAGCLMNMAGGLNKKRSKIRAMHLIDILAAREATP
jgi:L-lactate dehydrogenase complex protein LldE